MDRVVMIRRQIALELGTVVPIIRLRDNIQLNPNQYIIKIKGIQVTEGEILFDHYMAMNRDMWKRKSPVFRPLSHPSIRRQSGLQRTERACGESWLYRSRSAIYYCYPSDRGNPFPYCRTSYQTGCI